MEGFSGRSLLDQLEKCTGERIPTLAEMVSRHCPSRFSASRLHWKSGMPSRRQNCVSKDSHASTSSKDSTQTCLTVGAKAHCQAASSRVRRETSSTLISVLKAYHKMQYEEEWPRFETWWIRSERNTEQNLSFPTWVRQDKPTESVRNPKRQFKDWERSNCLNWQKFPRTCSAHRAPSTGQKDCYTALCGICLMPSDRSARSKVKSRPCPVRTTSWRRSAREVQSMDRPNGKMTIFSEILKLSSDGMKNIVDIWTRSCPLISHTQLKELSVKDMRTILLLASMVKDTSRDQWRIEQISHMQFTISFRPRPIEEKARLERRWKSWGRNNWVTIFFLLFNLVDATRMARMARISTGIGVSHTGNSDSLCKRWRV